MTPPPHPRLLPTLCVADASILIDCANGRVIACLPELPYHYIVPDAVLQELRPAFRTELIGLGFAVRGLESQTIQELYAVRPHYPRLSVPDLFAFFLAHSLQATLLTGDRGLTMLGTSQGLAVHGTLWLLDRLVEQRVLGCRDAVVALELMLALGARLPADECNKRRECWK